MTQNHLDTRRRCNGVYTDEVYLYMECLVNHGAGSLVSDHRSSSGIDCSVTISQKMYGIGNTDCWHNAHNGNRSNLRARTT